MLFVVSASLCMPKSIGLPSSFEHLENAECGIPFRSTIVSPSFEKAVGYMRDNFTDPSLTVSALADIACMSTTYFRKLFFSYFSDTPSKYITRLRMECAEKLLAEGDLSCEDVASLSGFNDSKYFCKVVKEFYGCPPSHLFRRRKS